MNLPLHLQADTALPADADTAVLIGRVWLEGQGPVLVQVRRDGFYDLSKLAATSSQLLELTDPANAVRNHAGAKLAQTQAVLDNSACDARNPSVPWLLAPCDLQAIKAAGVTFVASMLERVIEEQARGDAGKAQSIRAALGGILGDNLAGIVPGDRKSVV